MNTLEWYNKIVRFAEDNPKLGSIQYKQIEIIAEFIAKEEAAQHSVSQTGLTDSQKECVRRMIQSALDTGSA